MGPDTPGDGPDGLTRAGRPAQGAPARHGDTRPYARPPGPGGLTRQGPAGGEGPARAGSGRAVEPVAVFAPAFHEEG